MKLETVWITNLISFIEGKFPADEKWKAAFITQLKLAYRRINVESDQMAYSLGYDNPSLSHKGVFTFPHLTVLNAYYCGQGDAQNCVPKAILYDAYAYDLPTCERKPVSE